MLEQDTHDMDPTAIILTVPASGYFGASAYSGVFASNVTFQP